MTATAIYPPVAALEAAANLARSIRASAEWRAWRNAQNAAKADERLAGMVARQGELAGIQGVARERREGFDGKLLVELIALQEQIRQHELYLRQQEAWSAVTALLQLVNETISHELGLDFASIAAPRRGGCCG